MLNVKQIRMLELLDKKVNLCTKCDIETNGKALPTWHSNNKYCLIGEAPSTYDVGHQRFFFGGSILANNLGKLGFKASEFLIINSIQCVPFSRAKPSDDNLSNCHDWVRKYIKVVNPSKILCLGNFAKSFFNGSTTGITSERGIWNYFKLDGSLDEFPVMFTVHPAFCIYNEDGEKYLREDLTLFKETKFEERSSTSDWLFSEAEFMI